MGCLDKLLDANCKIILILAGMVLFSFWCNVGYVILVIRNYLNHELYHLDLYIQIPSDFITLLILKYTPSLCLSRCSIPMDFMFSFLGHRLICDVARDHRESWTVTVQLFKDFLSVFLRCGCCRSGRDYAHAHELHFGFANQYKVFPLYIILYIVLSTHCDTVFDIFI